MGDERVRVIGVGASAGGLEALQELFSAAAPTSNTAYVVVQHLAPDHESLVASLLARNSTLTFERARRDLYPQPGHVYVIQPKTRLVFDDEMLRVEPFERNDSLFLPIDELFDSMAKAFGPDAVGVILSGTGSDGSRGARHIKEAGGLIIVQEPDEAAFDGMPRSVLRTVVPDLVVRASAVSHHVAYLLEHGTVSLKDEGELHPVLQVLQNEIGLDFSHYKPAQVHRRIARRMSLLAMGSAHAYAELLLEKPGERRAIEHDLLIGVTRFFRDPAAWMRLREELNAIWTKNLGDFRVWLAGCSTGEEAYSMAMLLAELNREHETNRPFRVFATDVSQAAVEFAMAGNYSSAVAADVPRNLLERYFVRMEDGGWRVRQTLRESVLFSRHDVLSDAPFNRVDLVICRNVLIYFKPAAQRQVLDTFAFACNDDGLLFLGTSESVSESTATWVTIDSKNRILQIPERLKHLAKGRTPPTSNRSRTTTRSNPPAVGGRGPEVTPDRFLHRLGTGYMPGYVLFDSSFTLQVRSGSLGTLLQLPDGVATLDVRRMLPETVASVVASAPRRLEEQTESDLVVPRMQVGEGAQAITFDLRVRSLGRRESGTWYAALFEGLEEAEAPPDERHVALEDAARMVRHQVEELEAALEKSNNDLRSTVEQLEASNEELQSTNEELLASNEELQSLNEELQSVNEELHSVNSEHQAKILELSDLNTELQGLLRSLDLGVVVLDANGCIVRFNGEAERVLELQSGDLGRPLAHLRSGRVGVDIAAMAGRSMETSSKAESLAHVEGRATLVRVTPLDTIDSTGRCVITLTDVASMQRTEEERDILRHALDAMEIPVCGIRLSERTLAAPNSAMTDLLGESAEQLEGRVLDELLSPPSRVELERALDSVRPGHPASCLGQWSPEITNGALSCVFQLRPPIDGSKALAILVCEVAPFGRVPNNAGFMTWNARTDVSTASARTYELLGVPPGSLPPRPSLMREGMSRKAGDELNAAIAAAIDTGVPQNLNFQHSGDAPGSAKQRLALRVVPRVDVLGRRETLLFALWPDED